VYHLHFLLLPLLHRFYSQLHFRLQINQTQMPFHLFPLSFLLPMVFTILHRQKHFSSALPIVEQFLATYLPLDSMIANLKDFHVI